MTSKHAQLGALNGGVIAMLVGASALGSMLVYSAMSGHELPLWPALAVIAVNLVAAGRLAWVAIKAKRRP